MANPKSDWAPSRDPKKNARYEREANKQAAIEAAYLKNLQAFRERRAEKLPAVEKYINQQIPILLTAWQGQVDNAITDEDYSVEQDSKAYWWIALSGNLVWAATCFLNPAAAGAATLIKVMSFTGAAFGSGTLEKASPTPETPGSPKEAIRKQIAKARGRLEEEFQKKRHEWASHFSKLQDWDKPDGTLLDEFNSYIWTRMFPTIPYDTDRFDQIRMMAAKAVKSTVADYNRQWRDFQRANVWSGAKERKKHNVVFQPVLRVSFEGTPLWDAKDVHNAKKLEYR